MKFLRVFVSSTFRDMGAERDELIRRVFPRVNDKLRQYRVHVDPVDLRWGVLGDEDATEACRQAVLDSHVVLVLLGERYGWTPPSASISITEDEIVLGALATETRRPIALFYFRATDCTRAIPQPHWPRYIEQDGSPSALRLRALKSKVLTQIPDARVYDAIWEEASERLTGLEVFTEQVTEDLYRAILSMLDVREDGHESPLEVEATLQSSFVEEHARRFVVEARRQDVERLAAFVVEHPQAIDRGARLLIAGEPGSGRTALLAQLVHTLKGDDRFRVLANFPAAGDRSREISWTARRLTLELDPNVEEPASDLSANVRQHYWPLRFAETLREAAKSKPVVLVLDELDFMEASASVNGVRGQHLVQAPPGVRLIYSASASDYLANARGVGTEVRELAPLNVEQRSSLAEQFLSFLGKKLDAAQINRLVSKQGAESPAYLLAALRELSRYGSYEGVTSLIDEMPRDLTGLQYWLLARLCADPLFATSPESFVRTSLAFLVASHGGLTSAELISLLETAHGSKINAGNVHALLHTLRPSLQICDGRYFLTDRALRDAIRTSPVVAFDAQARTWHSFLADMFVRALGDMPRSHRTHREALHNLARAGREVEAAELLMRICDVAMEANKLQSGTFMRLSAQEQEANVVREVMRNFQIGRWHPKSAEHQHNLGPQSDYAELYTFPCCGRHMVVEHIAPPRFEPHGCIDRPERDDPRFPEFDLARRNAIHSHLLSDATLDQITDVLR